MIQLGNTRGTDDELIEVSLGGKVPTTENELEFQSSSFSDSANTFNNAPIGSVSTSSTSSANRVSTIGASTDGIDPSASASSGPSFCPFLNISYYQPYFDVTTTDVLNRMKSPFIIWKDDFFESVAQKPDMYGPFWISTTLVFFVAVTANINAYLSTTKTSVEEWNYNMKFLSVASTVIYGFCVGGPALLWMALKYQNINNLSLLQSLTIYGYSIITFLPASLLCVIPNHGVQWAAVFIAFGFSTIFLSRNLWKLLTGASASYSQISPSDEIASVSLDPVTESSTKKNSTIAFTMTGFLTVHAVFSLCMKILFFVGAEIDMDLDDNNKDNGSNSTNTNGLL